MMNVYLIEELAAGGHGWHTLAVLASPEEAMKAVANHVEGEYVPRWQPDQDVVDVWHETERGNIRILGFMLHPTADSMG